jgi:hypothetical protein
MSARIICTYTFPRTIPIMTNRIWQSETTAGLKWDACLFKTTSINILNSVAKLLESYVHNYTIFVCVREDGGAKITSYTQYWKHQGYMNNAGNGPVASRATHADRFEVSDQREVL